MGHATFGLCPDLVGGSMVMCTPVGIVGILIRIKIFFGFGGNEFPRFSNGAIGAVARIGINNIRAVGSQNACALKGNVGGHAQRDRKSLRSADHSVGNPGVAAGRIQQNFSTDEFSVSTRLCNDVCRGAVLHRSSWIEPLRFSEKLDARHTPRHTLETD